MKNFLHPTRRRIILLLQSSDRTVAELATKLKLTGNAVRAHLEALLDQNLVTARGQLRGKRRPHMAYTLTREARTLLFEGCHPLLSELIAVLADKSPEEELQGTFRECGRKMGRALLGQEERGAATLEERIELAIRAFNALGGQPTIKRESGRTAIRGLACPWAVIVKEHPVVCVAAESLLSELLGRPVRERCSRGDTPRCYFEIG